MYLENEVDDIFKIDRSFYTKLEVRTTFKVSDNIKRLFLYATAALAEQLKEEGVELDRTCRCIFLNTDNLTIKLNEDSKAEYASLCIYAVHKWNNIINNDKKILGVILEELCHYYFDIDDEVDICYKVLEVAKRIDQNIQLGEIYNIAEIERLKNHC